MITTTHCRLTRRPSIIKLLLTVAGTLLLSSGEAPADTVILKAIGNEPERRIDGTVLSVGERDVLFRTSDGTQLPLSRSAVSSIHFQGTGSSAPIPGETLIPLVPPKPSLETLYQGLGGSKTLQFPGSNGSVDEKRFITLSRFTGNRSGALYAGLYNFSDKGTFWIHLPEPTTGPGALRLTLYGKKNEGQPSERFSAKARYVDANGRVIGESPLAFFTDNGSGTLEWFRHLEGVSGLGSPTEVQWPVPSQTRSIEIRAEAESGTERHLVGYLGNLILSWNP